MISKESIHASVRFGLGAKPGELERISRNPMLWVTQQISKTPIREMHLLPKGYEYIQRRSQQKSHHKNPTTTPSSFTKTLTTNPYDLASPASAHLPIPPDQPVSPNNRKTFDDPIHKITSTKDLSPDEVEQVSWLIELSNTNHPVKERWILFWANHFSVEMDRIGVPGLSGALVRESIRPNVFKKYHQLCYECLSHPAMLLSNENHTEIGRQKTANIIMNKLDGTDEDRIALSHALSGIRVAEPNETPNRLTGIIFEENKSILFRGKHYGPSEQQLQEIIKDICVEQSVYFSLCYKIARHFISDTPTPSVVEKISQVWKQSDGDLAEIAKYISKLEEAWNNPWGKLKTPLEYIVSILRATSITPDMEWINSLNYLEQPFFTNANGWSDRALEWSDPSIFRKRMEWGINIGRRLYADPFELVKTTFGNNTLTNIDRHIEKASSNATGLIFLLTSPEFQRR